MALDINNILQSLPQVDQSAMPAWARPPQTNVMQQAAPQPAEAPRQRRGFLDTVGRIADVFARVGGAEAMYQPTLDANTARMQQVDLDAMKKQQMQQQLRAGKIGIENDERTRFGQALGGLIGAPDAAALWPQLAEQAGIAPDKAAAIGMAIQQNPNIIEPLAMSFGFTPPKEGSLPASIQNFQVYRQLMESGDTQGAETLMRFAQPQMEGVRPIDQMKLTLDEKNYRRQVIKDRRDAIRDDRELKLKEEKTAGGTDNENLLTAFRLNRGNLKRMNDALTDLKDAGSINSAGQGIGERVGAAIYENVPFAERLTNTKGFTARKNLRSSAMAAITKLEPLIQQAMGSGVKMSARMMDTPKELELHLESITNAQDYDSAKSAFDEFKKRYDEAEKAIEQQLKTQRPAGGGGENNTPRPGTVQQGYRFKGGNPADKSNWVKVQ